jgi:hypothetical protein
MTGTNLQRKRSDHGASLILVVSIIGLAFIVTVAAFLMAASYSQDRARLASAKVDVATREDALMREILQQTATGMLPGTNGVTGPILNWTAIMTNAANNLRATSYVDPAELAALQSAGAIPANVTLANLGDTGGGNPLDIFKGCTLVPHIADVPWSEVPFGGTSGLANCAPNLAVDQNGNVIDPPLMNWSRNTTLVSATAATSPQEFFLGSLNTAGTPPTQSSGNRWAQLTYPNIRFGYKQPGNSFVARRVWWRIPVVYQPAQPNAEYQTITDPASANSYKIVPANYVLSVYEIPSQLPISGNANLQIGADTSGTAWDPTKILVTGSISGNQITLSGGSYSGVSSRGFSSGPPVNPVNVVNPATVGGVAYSDSTFDRPGTREQMALTQTPGAAAPVSVAGNDGKVLLVPVMPGNEFYMPAPGAPTHWDLYARPYYRCRIRVIISNTDSKIIYNPNRPQPIDQTAGAIAVQIIYLPDPSSSPDQILGFPDSDAPPPPPTFTQTSIAAPNLPPYLNYWSTATGDRNILIIDVPNMVTALGKAFYGGDPSLAQVAPQLYSIYIGSNPTTAGVAIKNTNDLSAFTSGLSIVTNQTLYLLDSFNQVSNPQTGLIPTSLYAPQVVFGGIVSATNPQVNLTDHSQVVAVATPGPTPVNPLNFTNVNGNPIGLSNTNAKPTEVTDPKKIPPITALNLLFTIEKEH